VKSPYLIEAVMTRGIISIYWGDETKLPIDRLRNSIKKFHPELEYRLIKVDAPSGDPSSLNRKAAMLDLSPFDETLFLDLDTVVLGRLDFGFEKAIQHDLAIAICEAPWGRRYPKLFQGDEIEYNTGVLFFTKKAKPLFDKWQELAQTVDSAILGINEGQMYTMPANDQGSFALAVDQLKFNPFVLPLNWNFRPMWHKSFFGPIKIWHDYSDPPVFFDEQSAYYADKNAIIQYHEGG
jgi:hypothetical protein